MNSTTKGLIFDSSRIISKQEGREKKIEKRNVRNWEYFDSRF